MDRLKITYGSIITLRVKTGPKLAVISDGYVDKNVYLRKITRVPSKSKSRAHFIILPATSNQLKVKIFLNKF
jgi:hypothetical protein